jgi:hypothetical protein
MNKAADRAIGDDVGEFMEVEVDGGDVAQADPSVLRFG